MSPSHAQPSPFLPWSIVTTKPASVLGLRARCGWADPAGSTLRNHKLYSLCFVLFWEQQVPGPVLPPGMQKPEPSPAADAGAKASLCHAHRVPLAGGSYGTRGKLPWRRGGPSQGRGAPGLPQEQRGRSPRAPDQEHTPVSPESQRSLPPGMASNLVAGQGRRFTR